MPTGMGDETQAEREAPLHCRLPARLPVRRPDMTAPERKAYTKWQAV